MAGGTPRSELPGRDLGRVLTLPVNRDRVGISEYNEFGIRRSAIYSLRYKVILQLPADREAFLARIPRAELLPSVNCDHEVVQVFDREHDPFERENLAPDRIPPQVQKMLDRLRTYMQHAPEVDQREDPKATPQALIDDLRSLGYVQ